MNIARYLLNTVALRQGAEPGGGGGGAPPAVGTGAPPAGTGDPAGGGQQQQQQQQQQQTAVFDLTKHPDENVRTLMTQKGFDKDPSGNMLATSYYHANKALSGAKDVVPIPAADAGEDAWNKFYTTMGRPEKPEGYEFKFEEGLKVDEPFQNFAKGFFHKAGIPASRAQALVDAWQGYVKERVAAEETETTTANTQAVAALKSQLGNGADAFIASGQQAIAKLGLSAEALAFFDRHRGSAAIVELAGKLGQKMGGEDTFKNGNSSGGFADTPEGAAAEIQRLQGDAEFQKKYTDPRHPEHKTAVERMQQLFMKRGVKRA
jgi:hypothetical protein